tara:strand:- start:1543 stop:2355 length:813 start_codon:yes stop_codon:yes gene_type:complete
MSSLEADVTAIIKTFNRPESVRRLVNSIRKYYPNLNLIIVDDGEQKVEDFQNDKKIKYIKANFNIGLSAGRNLALSHVKSKFTLLLDDDFEFTGDTDLERMHSILVRTKFDVVGGDMLNWGTDRSKFHGTLELKDRTLRRFVELSRNGHEGLKEYDIIINFFMAKTDILKNVKWDPQLKLGEHEDFFIRLKEVGGKVTHLKSVTVNHFPEKPKNYQEYREKVHTYLEIAYKKHGIESYFRVSPPRMGWKAKIFKIYPKSICLFGDKEKLF